MPQIKVTIDDRVREELVLVTLDAAHTVSDVLDKLVEDWGLPDHTLDRQPVWYDLLRLRDGSRLDKARTLAEQGVAQGDTLQLVSKEGRETWLSVRDLLEEVRDKLVEEAVDRLKESALDALKRRLEQAAGTGAEARKVKELEAKLKAASAKTAKAADASAKSSKAASGAAASAAKSAAGKAAAGAGKAAEAGAKSGGGGVLIGCLVVIGLIVGGVVLLGLIGGLVNRLEAEPPPPPTQESVFFPTDEPLFDPPDVAPGEPELGTGDVQVTLRWYSEADLDLYVVDPSGEEISFQQPTTSSGGTLDVDSNRDCSFATTSPVENVYWPPGGAPSGRYTVYVNYFASCGGGTGPQSYEVTVLLDGQVWQVFSDTLDEFDTQEVITFSY